MSTSAGRDTATRNNRREDQNAVDVERSLGVARPRRTSAGGGRAVERSQREESGLGACRKLRTARPRRRCPNCGPEKRVGHVRPGKKLMIPPVRFSAKQQPRLGRSKRMSQHRGLLTPEERARIMQLQDLLIDRFVEHREATAVGQEERVATLEAEIDSLLREKDEIEKWAVVGSA